jgi:peptide/nickel transport system substrate-binding protein
VTNDLISFAPDEPFGCGLWEPTTIESERMVAEVNETHWASDMVNWPNYEWIPTFWQARPEVQQQSLISGELDGSIRVVNATEDLLDQIPGEPIFPRVPTYNGFGINLNHTVEPLGDHRVRQALQHLIDFQKMAGQAVSMEHVDDTRYTGMSRYYVDNYLTDEVGNNLIDYGGRGVETARNLLKEAGLAENGDQWELPSGGQFTLDMLTVSGRVPWAQIAKNNFENIGIPVSINTEEASTFFGQSVPNGDFETALWTAGGWRQPFAFSDFNQTWNVDATPYAEGTQADLNPEIPWPMEGSGATREIDILSKINELGRATTTEDRNRLASELGWVYNVTVPQIKVTERHFVGMIQTDNWEVPAEDAEEMNVLTPVHYLPKLDAMKAKTE